MTFNSLAFIIFALLFFMLWPLMRGGNNRRWIFITIASFIFYGWWDWRFLFLLAGTGLIDYFAALGMELWPRRRKPILIISLIGNLGSLSVFKYSGFIAENLDIFFHFIGINSAISMHIPRFTLILPVGISFYTFQSMSYTIDVYRDNMRTTKNVFHFFAYLSLFPQLVAGPIVRASELLPQLLHAGKPTERDRWDGTKLIIGGFCKKVLMADTFAPVVAAAFSDATLGQSSLHWWLVITLFAFQIYYDFSGYSDIARGLARWMGYDFLVNFNHPYIATSMREFWTRWHISLSTWFRDYVYIPLGGSRLGQWAAHKNMWITMLLSGLWHGAAWHFIAWSACHAGFLSFERVTKWPEKMGKHPAGVLLCSIAVILQTWVAWVFFRAQSTAQAMLILKKMFSFSGGLDIALAPYVLALLMIALLFNLYALLKTKVGGVLSVQFSPAVEPVLWAAVGAATVFLRGPGCNFIYFQF